MKTGYRLYISSVQTQCSCSLKKIRSKPAALAIQRLYFLNSCISTCKQQFNSAYCNDLCKGVKFAKDSGFGKVLCTNVCQDGSDDYSCRLCKTFKKPKVNSESNGKEARKKPKRLKLTHFVHFFYELTRVGKQCFFHGGITRRRVLKARSYCF